MADNTTDDLFVRATPAVLAALAGLGGSSGGNYTVSDNGDGSTSITAASGGGGTVADNGDGSTRIS